MIEGEALVLPPEAAGAAKGFLRVERADEDGLIGGLVAAAAELCERFTGQALLARGFTETMKAGPGWQRLGRTPVRAIVSVEALPDEGPAQMLASGAYALDIDSGGDGWVRLTAPGDARRIRVGYQAGVAASWADLPAALRHGILRLAAHFYTSRAAEGPHASEPPAAVTALCGGRSAGSGCAEGGEDAGTADASRRRAGAEGGALAPSLAGAGASRRGARRGAGERGGGCGRAFGARSQAPLRARSRAALAAFGEAAVSAGTALRSAAIEVLEALELGGVYPGPPLQAAFPHAIVECGPETDWGHKSGRGRELRLAVTLRDAGERPERAQAFAEVAEAAIEAGLDVEGWRLVTLAMVRSRTVAEGRGGRGGWAVMLEFRARMLAE